ncbi:MAG: type I methionyl aminopeptidase [Candidatus Omnitrophica bacterium]|nr:type I methionyl aminopeptidase [Candidatus Omnitrophota bacterium]
MIPLKSERELTIMKKGGRIVALVLDELYGIIKPGIKTVELDRLSEKYIKECGARPAFKEYRGFPANICVSVNEEIVHGIPGNRILAEGDIISVDVGVELEGYFTDSARTYAVGKIDDGSKKLMCVTEVSLEKALEQSRAGNRLSAISCAIQDHVENNGFSIIRAFVGHGIGSQLHEAPEVPNFGTRNSGVRLESGMVLAIEPMVSAGKYKVEILKDGWTAVTADRSRVAHYEHTIAITDDGPEVLTLCQKKKRYW